MNDANNKRTVTVIPADERKQTRVQPGQKLKVAAYCRVPQMTRIKYIKGQGTERTGDGSLVSLFFPCKMEQNMI